MVVCTIAAARGASSYAAKSVPTVQGSVQTIPSQPRLAFSYPAGIHSQGRHPALLPEAPRLFRLFQVDSSNTCGLIPTSTHRAAMASDSSRQPTNSNPILVRLRRQGWLVVTKVIPAAVSSFFFDSDQLQTPSLFRHWVVKSAQPSISSSGAGLTSHALETRCLVCYHSGARARDVNSYIVTRRMTSRTWVVGVGIDATGPWGTIQRLWSSARSRVDRAFRPSRNDPCRCDGHRRRFRRPSPASILGRRRRPAGAPPVPPFPEPGWPPSLRPPRPPRGKQTCPHWTGPQC